MFACFFRHLTRSLNNPFDNLRLWVAAGPFPDDAVLLAVADPQDTDPHAYAPAALPAALATALQGPGAVSALAAQGAMGQRVSGMLRKRRVWSSKDQQSKRSKKHASQEHKEPQGNDDQVPS